MKSNGKKVVLSKATIQYIKNKYRHLFDSDIEALIWYGEIIIKEIEKYSGYIVSVEKRCALKIPEHIASHYMIDKEIFLIPDEDGCLYTLVEDTEEKDVLKTEYVICTRVKLMDSLNSFEALSKCSDEYPSDFMIKSEMEKLKREGFEVFSARVEKRYRLI